MKKKFSALFEENPMNRTITKCKKKISKLNEMCKEYNIDIEVIYDIGANVGIYTIHFAKTFNNSKIYSFEPVKNTFEILKKNINNFNYSSRIFAYNRGISINNKYEKKILSIPLDRESENIGLYSLKIKDEFKKDSILAKFRPLTKFNLPNPDFIKIDVEGSEEEIINNNKKIFSSAKILMVEIAEDRIEESNKNNYLVSNKNLKKIIEDLGFKHVKILGSVDYIFINKKNLL